MTMNGRLALEAVRAARGDEDVVITTMGTARDWAAGGIGPLDFVLVPSSMGTAPSLGLGLALAQPDRRVIVLNGDGSMLMNLGSLVSIAAQAPTNLVIVVFENGVYEVTGGQPTPGVAARVDFVAVARASGFPTALRFTELDQWRSRIGPVLAAAGPTFVVLEVAAVPDAPGPRSPGPAPERARQFRERAIFGSLRSSNRAPPRQP
jgi:thiamine pyrophosphate-dependent acetolactate synthase large subunit-like protein